MRTIRVSAWDLFFVLDSHLPGTNHYLDAETGDVIPVLAWNRNRVVEQAKAEHERYIRLAPLSGRRGYQAMQEFIETVSRSELRTRLEAALKDEHPFSSFRTALNDDRAEFSRWKEFRTEAITKPLRERLKQQDIVLELIQDEE